MRHLIEYCPPLVIYRLVGELSSTSSFLCLSFSDVYIFVLCPEKRRRALYRSSNLRFPERGGKQNWQSNASMHSLLVIYSLAHDLEHLSFSAFLLLIKFLFCIHGSGVHIKGFQNEEDRTTAVICGMSSMLAIYMSLSLPLFP